MSGGDKDGDSAAPDTVWDWRLADFSDRLASDAPTPGGGSAAMVAATLGAGLVIMALRVTANRPDADPAVTAAIAEGDALRSALARHADADIAVFGRFMAALRLPRTTETEKEARRAALQAAAVEASRVPIAAARSVAAALDLARRAVPLVTASIVSDVGAGAALLEGAARAVLLVVDVNLRTIADGVIRAELAAERDALLARTGATGRDTVAAVRERLA